MEGKEVDLNEKSFVIPRLQLLKSTFTRFFIAMARVA